MAFRARFRAQAARFRSSYFRPPGRRLRRKKRTAWVPAGEKARRLPSAGLPNDSPQCFFRRDLAKVAPIAAFLIAFLRVRKIADSMAERSRFEPRVRFRLRR